MNMRMLWLGILGITIGLTSSAIAADGKGTDFAAEQEQIAKEDAEQKAERARGIKGKYQRKFYGTVYLNTQANGELSPDVVGFFQTNKRDLKPGRTYQMKLVGGRDALVAALKKMNGKPAVLTGKLRLIGPNGEAKYVVVNSVQKIGPTQKVPERRSASGL